MTNVRAFIEARDRLAALHTSVGLSDELQSIAVCVLDAVFALMESAAPALSAGEDHDWFDSGLLNGALSCRACGVVKSKCRGAVKVGPREADIAAAVDAATRPDWGRNPAPPAREETKFPAPFEGCDHTTPERVEAVWHAQLCPICATKNWRAAQRELEQLRSATPASAPDPLGWGDSIPCVAGCGALNDRKAMTCSNCGKWQRPPEEDTP